MIKYSNYGLNKDGLKMDLITIRNSINTNKRRWNNILTTNCYAYALGLDIAENEIKECAYQPGVISCSFESIDRTEHFAYSTLIDCIHSDMQKLGIDIREVDPFEIVPDDEWKIALFTVFHAYEFYSEYLSDFHFLRQNKDGIWYHKPGYYKNPTNKDYNRQIITNPLECELYNKQYRKCYSLKLR